MKAAMAIAGLTLVLAGAGPVRAQGGAPAPAPARPGAPVEAEAKSEQTMREEASKHYDGKRWAEAAALYERLIGMQRGRMEYVMRYGDCCLRMNKLDKAEEQFKQVLQDSPNNLVANFALARIYADREGEEAERKARGYLRDAAKYGFNAIGALRDSEYDRIKTWRRLREDVEFNLELLQAPRDRYTQSGRNPFENPLPPLTTPDEGGAGTRPPVTPGGPWSTTTQKQYIEDLRRFTEQLKKQLAAGDRKGVRETWAQIRDLERDAKQITLPEFAKELQQLRSEISDKETQVLITRFLLQSYEKEGNEALDKMDAATKAGQFDEVVQLYPAVERLGERMKQDNPDFAIIADDMVNRARQKMELAKKLKDAGELAKTLSISGILEGSEGGKAVSRAIINNRIYDEGDPVLDREGAASAIQVLDIQKSKVRFKFQDVEFDVPIRTVRR